MRVLVVDGANVVGSVPDGWWLDRAGAAGRLHLALTSTDLPYDVVLLVLEGKARAGVPAGTQDAVTTVHATGSGDDEIVRRTGEYGAAGATVTVATADRELISRLRAWDVTTLGPRTLRAQLNDQT